MARSTMGMDFGLDGESTCYKKKNRWLFYIPEISADDNSVECLPPFKTSRPSFSFKELEAQHITETIYFPGKPEWKPITLYLYDIKREGATENPIFKWLKELYDPQNGTYVPSCDGWKKRGELEMYDGCGNVVERWIFENIWPQQAEFGELDMGVSDIATCDLTIRYDRAYIEPT